MPLVCDATALVALGGIESINVLKHIDPEVVISPWVKERELRRFSDQGEAETLVVAGHQRGRPTTVVIDEGEAFVFVQRALIGRDAARNWTLVCLADILHDLEARDSIDSASSTMQRLLNGEHYRWSPAVLAHYSRRCEQRGTIPVPKTASKLR